VDNHKHLGLTLSCDLKWHKHINNISASASKVLGSMRALKFQLKRSTLNQIYISYMRPILEYASIVWDGCAAYEKQSLEQLQYEAARIITGATRSVSIDFLVKEVGWVSLSDRRKIQKLVIVYKAKKGLLPDYLSSLFPPTVSEISSYPLRNNNDYVTIARRTQLYNASFLPSSLELWNNLDPNIRNSQTLNIFKSRLKNLFKAPTVPKHYFYGQRYLSILHTRLRNNCSNLNNDLYNNHLREDPFCQCDIVIENAEHFFFKCNRYVEQRIILFRETRSYHPLNIDTLLFGRENLEYEDNVVIFESVQKFVKTTHRFDNI
jgi:hypothetical protein